MFTRQTRCSARYADPHGLDGRTFSVSTTSRHQRPPTPGARGAGVSLVGQSCARPRSPERTLTFVAATQVDPPGRGPFAVASRIGQNRMLTHAPHNRLCIFTAPQRAAPPYGYGGRRIETLHNDEGKNLGFHPSGHTSRTNHHNQEKSYR